MKLKETCAILALLLLWGCGLRPMPPEGSSPATITTGVSATPVPPATVRTDTVPTSLSAPLEVVKNPTVPPEISALARSLTQGLSSDQDRAHALYRWLSENVEYDVEGLFAESIPDQDAQAVYRKKRAVCAGYANLFQAMASAAGLESEIVPGRSPDPTLELSGRFGPDQSNHAWNAVKIDGRWELLDSTWGAGYLNESKRFVSRPNDDWFMVDPDAFIYSHLPEDPKWQLLDSPISRSEFDHLPMLSPNFFSYGFEMVEPTTQPVASAGESVFRVRSRLGYLVSAVARQKGSKLPESFVLSQVFDGEAEIRVRFPSAGEYQVYIMGAKPGEKTYVSVGSFTVDSNGATSTPFPQTYGTFHEHGVRILEGTDGVWAVDRPVRLSYRVPDAGALYLQVGEEQLRFEQSGETFSLDYTPGRGEAKVFAHFPGQERLWALAAYQAK